MGDSPPWGGGAELIREQPSWLVRVVDKPNGDFSFYGNQSPSAEV